VASFRSGVAALTLVVLLPDARRRVDGRALAIGFAYATTMVLFVLSNKLTTAASAIFLQATAPLWVVLLGPWLLGERLRRRDLGFVALLATGMALFFVGGAVPSATAPDPARGDLLATTSGVAWAFTIIGLRWLAAGTGVVGPALVAGNVIAFLACLPLALPLGPVSLRDAAIILYLGTCQIGLAYLFLAGAVRKLPAVEASLMLLVEPVLNALWAWWLHGEEPGPLPLAGGAIVLAATAVRTWREARDAGEVTAA
jgi:drug/metabolite transporter (DMT)-like permease